VVAQGTHRQRLPLRLPVQAQFQGLHYLQQLAAIGVSL
jgi:hypothetical protein